MLRHLPHPPTLEVTSRYVGTTSATLVVLSWTGQGESGAVRVLFSLILAENSDQHRRRRERKRKKKQQQDVEQADMAAGSSFPLSK